MGDDPVDRFFEKLLDQIAVIRASPRPHLVFAFLVAMAIWGAMQWGYGRVIDNKDSLISLVTEERDDYKNKLSGASPDEASARLASLTKQLENLSSRLGPIYPLTDQQKVDLKTALEAIPVNERFHMLILWPQINGVPRYANEFAQVFRSAKWDADVSAEAMSFGHGIGISFSQKTYPEDNRPPDAKKLMSVLTQAKVHYEIGENDALIVPYAFTIGQPE
jgi:hypothetical protein